MNNSQKEGFVGEDKFEGSDIVNQASDEVSEESSDDVASREIETSGIGSTDSLRISQENTRSYGTGSVLTERLRNILRDEEDVDILIQQNDRENTVLDWLQALDLQVMGACRADERLKPLLKLNGSSGFAENRFLVHLIQHFDAQEVAILARCVCIPLVSIRVGKVTKQGNLLYPTTSRGNLNLMILPSSDLRISFIGDDGCTERLVTLSSISESMAVIIEEIPADNSGRSFLVKLQGGQVSYFWCSEKSKHLGVELLAKMKDILRRKPSLAQLTGINKSRFDCFAIHLHAYLVGATMNDMQTNPIFPSSLLSTTSNTFELGQNLKVLSPSTKPKAHPIYQGSLSPRPNTFKDGVTRNLSSIRNGSREKFRRRGEGHYSPIENQPQPPITTAEASLIGQSKSHSLPEFNLLNSLLPLSSPTSRVPSMGSSLFSPYYCWCPPCTSTIQFTVTPPQLPISTESRPLPLPLPPLSSLLSAARSSSSLVPPKLPLSMPEGLPVAFIPCKVSSFLSSSCSQLVPSFNPLMCDPIVHIPLMDVCSSGQGYLVSAGPAITASIPTLHSDFVIPYIPETESVEEKSARETLRLLIGSTQSNPHLMEVQERPYPWNSLVAGSRGLYSGCVDIHAIANSVAAMGLISPLRRADELHRNDHPLGSEVEEDYCRSNELEEDASSGNKLD